MEKTWNSIYVKPKLRTDLRSCSVATLDTAPRFPWLVFTRQDNKIIAAISDLQGSKHLSQRIPPVANSCLHRTYVLLNRTLKRPQMNIMFNFRNHRSILPLWKACWKLLGWFWTIFFLNKPMLVWGLEWVSWVGWAMHNFAKKIN